MKLNPVVKIISSDSMKVPTLALARWAADNGLFRKLDLVAGPVDPSVPEIVKIFRLNTSAAHYAASQYLAAALEPSRA